MPIKNAKYWCDIGITCRDQNDPDGAIAAYDHALAIDDNHAPAWNGLGVARVDKKDMAGAIAAFDRALTINPMIATVWYNLGGAKQSLKDLKGAVKAYERALALDPADFLARDKLHAARGDLEKDRSNSRNVEEKPKFGKEKFDKLRKIIKVSESLEISRLANVLNFAAILPIARYNSRI